MVDRPDYFDIGLEHMDPARKAMLIERCKQKQASDIDKLEGLKYRFISKTSFQKFITIANETGNWIQNYQGTLDLIETLIQKQISPEDIDSVVPATLIGFGLKPAFEYILRNPREK